MPIAESECGIRKRSAGHRLRPALALIVLGIVGPGGSYANEPLTRIPFEIQANRIVVPMKVDDSPAMNILLDSGLTFEGVFLYHEKWVEALGMSQGAERNMAGAGVEDPTSTLMRDGRTLTVGGMRFSEQRVYVSRSPRTQRFPRDGVAGWTLFGNFVVEIDHESMTIALYDPSSFQSDPSWKAVAMELRDRIPWIEIGVDVSGKGEIPASVYIDLGAGDALLLLVRPKMKFEKPEGMERRYIGTGLSGDVHGEFGRVSSVRIGPFRLKDVATAFPDAEARSKQEGADGIIGSDLLRRFDVIFDYERSRILLKPNRSFETPFE